MEKSSEKSSRELVLQAAEDSTFSYYELQVPYQHSRGDLSLDTYIEQVKSKSFECYFDSISAGYCYYNEEESVMSKLLVVVYLV